jgi:hypothetical protein
VWDRYVQHGATKRKVECRMPKWRLFGGMAVAPGHRDAGFMAVYYGRQSIGVASRIDARNVDVVLGWPTGRVRDGMAMPLEDSLELLGRAVGWRCRSGLARHTVSKPRWGCFCYPSFPETQPHEVQAKRVVT